MICLPVRFSVFGSFKYFDLCCQEDACFSHKTQTLTLSHTTSQYTTTVATTSSFLHVKYWLQLQSTDVYKRHHFMSLLQQLRLALADRSDGIGGRCGGDRGGSGGVTRWQRNAKESNQAAESDDAAKCQFDRVAIIEPEIASFTRHSSSSSSSSTSASQLTPEQIKSRPWRKGEGRGVFPLNPGNKVPRNPSNVVIRSNEKPINYKLEDIGAIQSDHFLCEIHRAKSTLTDICIISFRHKRTTMHIHDVVLLFIERGDEN